MQYLKNLDLFFFKLIIKFNIVLMNETMKRVIIIKMSEEYKICKRCKHLQRNHLIYEGDNKCTKCDCQQFIG